MSEQADCLKERTHTFSVRVIVLCEALPDRPAPRSIGEQLIDRAGSNYRAACKARNRREFIAKLGIVIEEIDESGRVAAGAAVSQSGGAGGAGQSVKGGRRADPHFVASRETAEMTLEREERAEQAQKRPRAG